MIAVEKWGKDHWSTFAYLGTVVVGQRGIPDKDRMRTEAKRHPGLVGPNVARMMMHNDTEYPTRLKGKETAKDHDDWDCAEDAVEAGLLVWGGTGIHPVFRLTTRGWRVLKEVTDFKEKLKGKFADFVPSPEALATPNETPQAAIG